MKGESASAWTVRRARAREREGKVRAGELEGRYGVAGGGFTLVNYPRERRLFRPPCPCARVLRFFRIAPASPPAARAPRLIRVSPSRLSCREQRGAAAFRRADGAAKRGPTRAAGAAPHRGVCARSQRAPGFLLRAGPMQADAWLYFFRGFY